MTRGYECSPVGGGCAEEFRSLELFDRHLVGVVHPECVEADEIAGWRGVQRDTYGLWTTGDPKAAEVLAARMRAVSGPRCAAGSHREAFAGGECR